MKFLKLFSVCAAFSLFHLSCTERSKTIAEKTSEPIANEISPEKKFSGTFSGTTPCADCPGIETTVTFDADSSFIETLRYLERNRTFSDTGKWSLSDKMITVSFPSTSATDRYFLIKSPSSVAMLNADKKEIEGALADNFILNKTSK